MSKIIRMRIHDFGESAVLHADSLEPSLADALQILVRVKAASVNPVDYKIRNGKYPAVKEDRLPYALGRDVSGIVEQCGAQATRFKVGDEVLGMVDIGGGGYSEKVVIAQMAAVRKPEELDHRHAAAIPLAGLTAWQGLFRYGELSAGQRVLIHGGSGGVGHFAVQFAKARGATVVTTVATENVEFAKSLGADLIIDYKRERFEEKAGPLDLVFDLIDGDTRQRSWGLLKRGGALISTLTEPDRETAHRFGVRAMRYTVEADAADLEQILTLVSAGKVKPHLHQHFPLSKAAEALAVVERGGAVGKVVLTM
jgi:NADPH:quinone reductase-like Zn-dependent oxidoreductase